MRCDEIWWDMMRYDKIWWDMMRYDKRIQGDVTGYVMGYS